MTQTVKLAKLKRSEKNVRTAPPRNIDSMAASIRARGIMMNLLVTPSKPRGTFEIIAGNRRYLGAMMLAEQGEIAAADYDVPVKVVTGDDKEMREISTLENVERIDLTPAEECTAYRHFIETDGDVDAVAIRFGKTRKFVEGRLRLADLAEPISRPSAKSDLGSRSRRPTVPPTTRPSRSGCSSNTGTTPISPPIKSAVRSPTTP